MFKLFECIDGSFRVRKTSSVVDVILDREGEVVIRFTGKLTPLRVKGTVKEVFDALT